MVLQSSFGREIVNIEGIEEEICANWNLDKQIPQLASQESVELSLAKALILPCVFPACLL